MSWERDPMSWERDKYFFHMSPQCCRSVDPDEMQHYAFYLGLHCLQRYSLWGFPNTKGSYTVILCY